MQAELEVLTARIYENFTTLQTAAVSMLYAGIAIGETLAKVKETLPHGFWLSYVEEQLPFGHTAAASYLLVARHKDMLLEDEGVQTMDAALKKLRALCLTSHTKITPEKIALIKQTHAESGNIKQVARDLGISYGTAYRYANGATKREVRPHTGGKKIGITDQMIERMAKWLMDRYAPGVTTGIDDEWRGLALEALGAALRS